MKAGRLLRATVALMVLLGLSSCSLAYKVEIFVRNGAIIFVPYQLGMFGRRLKETPQVESVSVEKIAREPIPVWEVRSPDTNGTPLAELSYGTLPSGFKEQIRPEKIEVGQLYLITVMALGGGGDDYFVISPYSGYPEDPHVTFLAAQSVRN